MINESILLAVLYVEQLVNQLSKGKLFLAFLLQSQN